MRIVVDDCECSHDARTVADALAIASTEANRRQRRVVEVTVDGATWTNVELEDNARLIQSASEVLCVTVSPAHFLRETFLNAAEELGRADVIQRDAARFLQADNAKQGMDQLMQALSIWTSIQQATSQGLAFGSIDARSVNTDDGSFADAARDLNQRLTTLRNAMNENDTVAVSDCLLYDFPDTTRRWSSVLSELARRAETMMSNSAS